MAATRQRKANKLKEEGRKESEEENNYVNQGQQYQQQRTVRKRKVSWKPVFKTLACFMLAIAIPTLLNYAVLNQEARMLVPAGSVMYDIGWNQKLMLKCSGSGLPTVVLDAPVGQSSNAWVLVEPLIAKKTRVCVYDRAGIGFSERAYQNTSRYSNDFGEAALERDKTSPSTVERMVDDLHRLLSISSSQPKPFLLVGADFSTFVSRFYTQLYEHEVAGLFLIDPAYEGLFSSNQDMTGENRKSDSSTESQESLTWQEYWNKKMVPHAQGVWLSAVIGFNRLSLMVGLMSPVEDADLLPILPQQVVTRKKYLLCQPKHLSSVFYEYYFMNETMDQMKTIFKVKPFPNHLPVTIATYKAGDPPLGQKLMQTWKEGQEQLVKRFHPQSRRVMLPGMDYLTFYTHPMEVALSILDMVHSWRKEAKLAG